MKTAIVYYSLTGNVDFAAGRIARLLDAELIRIAPEKAYPDSGARKFLWGGKSAVMGEAPRLLPYDFRPEAYDCVVLGTPVWAGTFAPPLRTFLKEQQAALAGKPVAAFACSSGGSADKALEKLRQALGIPAFAARLALVDPKDKASAENDKKIAAFCAELKKL